MATTLTIKGQVTIPRRVRDALGLRPGDGVEFALNREGQVVVQKSGATPDRKQSRFQRARGSASIRWRTDELMTLLRGSD